MRFLILVGAGAVTLALTVTTATTAQAPARDTATFTTEQADRGRVTYDERCASCHGVTLEDGDFGPPLRGAAFDRRWGGDSVEALFSYVRANMPPSGAGAMSAGGYAEVVAYLLQANGVSAGEADLPSDVQTLSGLMIPAEGGAAPAAAQEAVSSPSQPQRRDMNRSGFGAAGPLPGESGAPSRLNDLTPVTGAMLAGPSADDWLNWRRTYDAHGFSPLDAITRDNVDRLQLEWSWALPPGPNEMSPLVHDGVLFMYSFGDRLQALDAVTGDPLWQYNHDVPPPPPTRGQTATPKKNIAIFGDLLLVPTSDVRMLALEATTGRVVWNHEIADYNEGWRITGGPLVAGGKVIQGMTTGRIPPGGGFIVALDVETGEEAWRFWTIARPDEPGGNSWNGLPLEARSGGSVWVAGSYDPELNLAYFGTAPTYDTGPLLEPIDDPNVTSEALYTNATVALDVDTGELVWYFQHLANDQWDMDWAFERTVAEVNINGTLRKVVFNGGKQAIFDALDAATGEYVFSHDMGLQNIVLSIDPETGAKTINPAVVPNGQVQIVCPHPGGVRSWIATSFNPGSKVLFVPAVESCMDQVPVPEGERGSLTSGVRWRLRARPDSDGNFGRVEAVNIETQEVVWTHRQVAPPTTATLATAGGVVFNGSLDRRFTAYDDATGAVLWQTRLTDVPSSFPISYGVGGRQFVAVVVGNGGAHAQTWPGLVGSIYNPPDGGASIFVFALPEEN